MKKRMRMLASLALAGTMVLSMAACGGKSDDAAAKKDDAKTEQAEETPEGKVLNIWCWNDEFQQRFNGYYPEVKEVAEDKSTTTLNDGTVVKWTINPNENNNYQNKLDTALQAQASAAEDDKIDIFLIEADYALKYVDADANVAEPLADLGITDDDLADQYQYTKDIVTDDNGAQRGTSWQATPGLFAYRRSIAKDVLGTDDPEKVQEKLKDWDNFNKVADEASKKGYKMLSGYDDSYRTFSNNVSAKWVDGTTVKVDPNLMTWVDQTKTFTDKGYNNKTSLWDESWNSDQGAKGKVFGFFYSTWGINFTLAGNAGEEGKGDWAVCEGPQPYFWGGTWICAAQGNDNPKTIKDVMLKLTCDKDIEKKITKDTQDYTNTISGMQEIADDPKFGSEFLGGQNHIKLFSEVAPQIDMSKTSPYDQGCNEEFQAAFKGYFDGTADMDTAKKEFETAIIEKYPELTAVEWP